MDGWMDGSLPVSLPSSSSAPSRYRRHCWETRGKLPAASSPSSPSWVRGIIVPRETGPEAVMHGACGGGMIKREAGGGDPMVMPTTQLPRASTSREHCWFPLRSLAAGGKGGGEGRADMLEMGPWLAIGADEMTLSCFLDRSGLPGLGEQSLVVACRLFARRRVSGWSRLAGLIHRGRVCAMGHAVSVGVGIRLTSNFCYPRAVV